MMLSQQSFEQTAPGYGFDTRLVHACHSGNKSSTGHNKGKLSIVLAIKRF